MGTLLTIGKTKLPMIWQNREQILLDVIPQEADRNLMMGYLVCRSSGEPIRKFMLRMGVVWEDIDHIISYFKMQELVKEAEDMRTRLKRQVLEDEADRRAVDGVQEDVYHQGDVVGQQTKYSDGLLKTRLAAEHPDKYSERHKHDVTGAILHMNFVGVTRAPVVKTGVVDDITKDVEVDEKE